MHEQCAISFMKMPGGRFRKKWKPASRPSSAVRSDANAARGRGRSPDLLARRSITRQTARPEPSPIVMPGSIRSTAAAAAASRSGSRPSPTGRRMSGFAR